MRDRGIKGVHRRRRDKRGRKAIAVALGPAAQPVRDRPRRQARDLRLPRGLLQPSAPAPLDRIDPARHLRDQVRQRTRGGSMMTLNKPVSAKAGQLHWTSRAESGCVVDRVRHNASRRYMCSSSTRSRSRKTWMPGHIRHWHFISNRSPRTFRTLLARRPWVNRSAGCGRHLSLVLHLHGGRRGNHVGNYA